MGKCVLIYCETVLCLLFPLATRISSGICLEIGERGRGWC